MVVVIWLNAGFAMVLLSAAIKGVPEETIEASRIDGAGERQTFFQVIVPQIWTTVVAVFITILITVMKIFDIVYAMTGGAYGTSRARHGVHQPAVLASVTPAKPPRWSPCS